MQQFGKKKETDRDTVTEKAPMTTNISFGTGIWGFLQTGKVNIHSFPPYQLNILHNYV